MKTSPRLLCTLCGRRKITMEQVLPTVGRQICHANISLICLKHSKRNESAPTRYHGGNCVVCFSKPTPSLATTAWPTLAQSSLFVSGRHFYALCCIFNWYCATLESSLVKNLSSIFIIEQNHVRNLHVTEFIKKYFTIKTVYSKTITYRHLQILKVTQIEEKYKQNALNCFYIIHIPKKKIVIVLNIMEQKLRL